MEVGRAHGTIYFKTQMLTIQEAVSKGVVVSAVPRKVATSIVDLLYKLMSGQESYFL